MTKIEPLCYISGTLLKGGADMANMVLFFVLLFASYFDWKEKRIPNRLIVIGLAPVMWTLGNKRDWQEIFCSVLFMLLVWLLCWPFYLLRGLGAGDIKLFILLMGVCGFQKFLFIALLAFIFACVFSLVKMAFAGDILSFFPCRFPIVKLGLPGVCDDKREKTYEKHTVILAPFVMIAYVMVMTERWWM